jgi:hypothetical protein
MIYLIDCICTPYFKVGYSDTFQGVLSRLGDMQVGCPYELRLIHWWELDRNVEQLFHESHVTYRERGEWYRKNRYRTNGSYKYAVQWLNKRAPVGGRVTISY